MPDLSTDAGEPAVDELSLRDELASAMSATEPDDAPDEGGPPVSEPGETAEQKATRERDTAGRFKAKEPAEASPQQATGKPVDGQKASEPINGHGTPDEAPHVAPPPSWSIAAKGEFDALPKAVQEAVARREDEVNRGLAELRDYKSLKPYAEAAQRSGVTLPQALERYSAAERLLDSNPIEGIRWFCEQYGVDPRQLMGQQPAQQQQAPQYQQNYQQQVPQYGPDLQPVLSRLQSIEQRAAAREEAERQALFSDAEAKIEKFYADPANRYANDVSNQMAALLKSGQATTLEDAYQTAIWANPDIRPNLINEITTKKQADQAAKAKSIAAQARQTGRSVTGGPATTPSPTSPNGDDLRASLEAAFHGRV